jgi:hypothetical protein
MTQIVAHLDLSDVRSARLVCLDWKDVVSASVLVLRPRSVTATVLSATFPALQQLELKGCRKILDEDFIGLHRVSTLKAISLEGCDGVTDAVAFEIAALPRLRSLSLKHCVKITDAALWTLSGSLDRMIRLKSLRGNNSSASMSSSPMILSPRTPGGASSSSSYNHPSTTTITSPIPPLETLDLSGCVLLTEHGFDCLPTAFPNLRELRVGGCNRVATVTDAALIGIGKCTRLHFLDLSGCSNITSTGLSNLSSLQNLKYLSLWNCLRLTSDSLEALAPCSALTELSLRGCQPMDDDMLHHIAKIKALCRLELRACEHLRGEEMHCLTSLHHLSELNLWGCYALSDVGLRAVGALSTLKILRLTECWQLTSTGLSTLSRLTCLEELDVAGCRNVVNTAGLPLPGLHIMHNLWNLTLKGCDRITCGALGFVTGSLLSHLDLSGCRELNGEALLPLRGCSSSLVSLKLQNCGGLRGANALLALEQLTALTFLHLGGCTNLAGTALASLAPLASLQHLNLEACTNVALLDRGLSTVGWCCSSLTFLSLQGSNSLTDEGVAFLGRLPCLKSVNMSDCSGITGTGFLEWKNCSPLVILQLQGASGLSDEGVVAMGDSLKFLKDLSLKHSQSVTDAGFSALGSLKNLTALSLQGMVGVSDSGVAALCSELRQISSLELQFCWAFGDEGARQLTNLTNLTSLDLIYSWKVTDETMHALAGMSSLRTLNIMGCHRIGNEGKAAVEHLLGDSRFI